jgi:leader peptidase (prepilin peptidase)/N-methyltransferase
MNFFDLLQSSPALFIGACTVTGLLVGSFLNVVAHRLPKMLERGWHQQCTELRGEEPAHSEPYNLLVPRSACPHCQHAISAWLNR